MNINDAAQIQTTILNSFNNGLRPALPIDNPATAGVDFWNSLSRPLTYPSLLTAYRSIAALQAASDTPLNGAVFEVQVGSNFYNRFSTIRRFYNVLNTSNDPTGVIQRLIRDISYSNRGTAYLTGFNREFIRGNTISAAAEYQNGNLIGVATLNPTFTTTPEVPNNEYPLTAIHQTFINSVEVVYSARDLAEHLVSTVACGLGFQSEPPKGSPSIVENGSSCANPKLETVQKFNRENRKANAISSFTVLHFLLM